MTTLTPEQREEIAKRAKRLRELHGDDLSPSAIDREALLTHIAEQEAALASAEERAEKNSEWAGTWHRVVQNILTVLEISVNSEAYDSATAVRDKFDGLQSEVYTLKAETEKLREALRPFAERAEQYGLPYLTKRDAEIARRPDMNLPRNYAQAVMAAAEQTGWADWERTIAALKETPND